jgi:hypothetical protein
MMRSNYSVLKWLARNKNHLGDISLDLYLRPITVIAEVLEGGLPLVDFPES